MLIETLSLLGVLTLALLSPGPDFIVVVRNSTGHHRARGLGTALGICVGLAVQTGAIALGFAAIPERALFWVQLVGAAFLGWLGVKALLAPRVAVTAPLAPVRRGADARAGFLQGLVCNLTNPKAFLFFVSLFAQVMRPGAAEVWRVVLPALVVVHGVVLWSLVVLAVQSRPVARRLERVQRWLPRCFGVALILLAIVVGLGAVLR